MSSSKTARLRRRQRARHEEYKRLRKSGRVPQHTRAERRRAEAERQRDRATERSREAWLRRKALPVIIATGVAAFIDLVPAHVSGRHSMYPYLSAARAALPGRPDLPHQSDTDTTLYTSYTGSGTARSTEVLGAVDSVDLDGSEQYNWWRPSGLGD